MASTIIIKNGAGSSTPSSLKQGEFAINVDSGKLFYGTSGSSNAVSSSFSFQHVTASGEVSASKVIADTISGGVGQNGLTLNFSANSNASGMDGESLDDFEEGTFTPTITSGMDNPTFSRAKGSYVKIGRQVLYQYHVIVTGGTLNGSHLIFGGLPFTSRNDANQAHGGAWLNYQGNTFVKGEEISFHTGLNETGFKCYKQDGTNLNGTDSAVNDITSEILWCGQYIV